MPESEDVIAAVENDLDIGRGPGQHAAHGLGVFELDLDLDGAVLLEHVEHVGRDPNH